jgi:hypothetical protein
LIDGFGHSIISCFPQMKPEALGYTTIDKLIELEKPGKLANDLNGFKKKNKLDLPGLSPEEVGGWIKI